jgi:ribonuclease Y
MEYVIAAVVGLLVGAVAARMWGGKGDDAALAELREQSDAQIAAARAAAEDAVRLQTESLSAESDEKAKSRRTELRAREERLRKRERAADELSTQFTQRENKFTKREKDLTRREGRLSRQEADVEAVVTEARAQLEAVAGLSPDQARSRLMDEVRDEARRQSIDDIRAIEQETKAIADERARLIISGAIQRYAGEHVTERTVISVALPSDDLKGRIIGREGRNIRAFEAATGCDLVVDDTPEAVIISGFNPVRREVAKQALERLVVDGRIHPARIEEVVGRTRKDMDQQLRKKGEAAALELEVTGLHPELLMTLGRLHHVTTFAQNALRHSIEVGFLAGAMASELGLNPKIARRAGLLHDIGRAVSHEVEGDHAQAGAALARKHSEKKAVVAAIGAHHDPAKQRTMLDHLVSAANTLSANRPGARREQLAAYISRLEELETLAQSFDGVEQCYALQAGGEVRVLVDNARLNDRDSDLLARDIAHRIEEEQSHPGNITVTVIRTTRAVQYAR